MTLKDVFRDALPIIKNFAPSIAAAIGGPVGVATGYVLPILASAFGVDSSNPRSIAEAILAGSNSEDTLKELEHEHGDWICKLLDSVGNLASAKINVELTWK